MKLKNKLGILGGSFDPAHKGHLAISKEAAKRYKLKKIIWAITKKNPMKKKSQKNITERIKSCNKIIRSNNLIKVRFYENIIKSNKTVKLISYIKKKTKLIIAYNNFKCRIIKLWLNLESLMPMHNSFVKSLER